MPARGPLQRATYAVWMEDLDAAAQPQCPEDRTVLREVTGAWECPLCGHRQVPDEIVMPPEFEGPSFPGF